MTTFSSGQRVIGPRGSGIITATARVCSLAFVLYDRDEASGATQLVRFSDLQPGSPKPLPPIKPQYKTLPRVPDLNPETANGPIPKP